MSTAEQDGSVQRLEGAESKRREEAVSQVLNDTSLALLCSVASFVIIILLWIHYLKFYCMLCFS